MGFYQGSDIFSLASRLSPSAKTHSLFSPVFGETGFGSWYHPYVLVSSSSADRT